jgi:hypothetical protein
MAKLPGKTVYSGRRRTVTRRSGFQSHPDSTGGELKRVEVERILLRKKNSVTITLNIPDPDRELYAGFGGYFKCDTDVHISIHNPNFKTDYIEHYELPNWSKIGSMWKTNQSQHPVSITFDSPNDTELAIYEFSCGLIWHDHFNAARPSIMRAMHKLSPEGNFYEMPGFVEVPEVDLIDGEQDLMILKSCNRCARFLPININDERKHLSFSNHCVSRAPCSHKGFGLLTDVDTHDQIQLYYGYQLECRFCKKYEVNAALNPQRTASQMKEDGQRRRHFELLLTELYQMSPQLAYRHKTGRELTDDIWNKFGGECFNCGRALASQKKMHLDHTRPLALLWPLDESATALCGSCNTQKRDRFPSEFYSKNQLRQLAGITGLKYQVLKSPEPNHEAIREILENIDWLFEEFLVRPDLLKELDGKIVAELVAKALDKVLDRSSIDYEFSFVEEYDKRR